MDHSSLTALLSLTSSEPYVSCINLQDITKTKRKISKYVKSNQLMNYNQAKYQETGTKIHLFNFLFFQKVKLHQMRSFAKAPYSMTVTDQFFRELGDNRAASSKKVLSLLSVPPTLVEERSLFSLYSFG